MDSFIFCLIEFTKIIPNKMLIDASRKIFSDKYRPRLQTPFLWNNEFQRLYKRPILGLFYPK